MKKRSALRGQPPASDVERSPLFTPLQEPLTVPQKKRKNPLTTRKGVLLSGLVLLFLLATSLGAMVLCD